MSLRRLIVGEACPVGIQLNCHPLSGDGMYPVYLFADRNLHGHGVATLHRGALINESRAGSRAIAIGRFRADRSLAELLRTAARQKLGDYGAAAIHITVKRALIRVRRARPVAPGERPRARSLRSDRNEVASLTDAFS